MLAADVIDEAPATSAAVCPCGDEAGYELRDDDETRQLCAACLFAVFDGEAA